MIVGGIRKKFWLVRKALNKRRQPGGPWTALMSEAIARASGRPAGADAGDKAGGDPAGDGRVDYRRWVEAFDTPDRSALDAMTRRGAALPVRPLISVVMPVYNTPEGPLRRAIESVLGQTYPDWQLCIADDASSAAHVRPVVEEYAARDGRIAFVALGENSHISEASNAALAIAKGEYVAFLDHDDELRPHALYMVAREINEHPEAGLIYSDEDKIDADGRRFDPFFKPDWNPDAFLATNYLCHLSVYRRDLIADVGGLRRGFEGAQDWDLAFRVVERLEPGRIRHIPHILYHWRAIEGSTALSSGQKPYSTRAQLATVRDALDRTGRPGEVDALDDLSILRVRFRLPDPPPLVSLVIPSGDLRPSSVRRIAALIGHTDYPDLEVVVVHNNNKNLNIENLKNTKFIYCEKSNVASMLNRGAAAAAGPVLGFLHDDLEVITPGWLGEMVAQALRPEIGAVGARLYYPNDLLQHCGIVLGIGGVADHICRWRPPHRGVSMQRNYSAVTAACLVTRRPAFEQAGGFDERLSAAYHDVDLCLRIGRHGLRTTWTPYAELYHWEVDDPWSGRDGDPALEGDRALMMERWGELLRNDPSYNPNLTLSAGDLALAFPPRAARPWESG